MAAARALRLRNTSLRAGSPPPATRATRGSPPCPSVSSPPALSSPFRSPSSSLPARPGTLCTAREQTSVLSPAAAWPRGGTPPGANRYRRSLGTSLLGASLARGQPSCLAAAERSSASEARRTATATEPSASGSSSSTPNADSSSSSSSSAAPRGARIKTREFREITVPAMARASAASTRKHPSGSEEENDLEAEEE